MQPDDLQFSSHDPDKNLAFALQHGKPGDPQLFVMLWQRFGEELARLSAALLSLGLAKRGRWEAASLGAGQLDELASNRAKGVLHKAIGRLESFWGREDLRLWLYELALEDLPLFAKPALPFLRRKEIAFPASAPRDAPPGEGWEAELLPSLLLLPPPARLALILRHARGLSLEACAALMRRPPAETHELLNRARLWLRLHLDARSKNNLAFDAISQDKIALGAGTKNTPAPGDLSSAEASPPVDNDGYAQPLDDHDTTLLIFASLDNLLEGEVYTRGAFERHLAECQTCRDEMQAWRTFLSELEGKLDTLGSQAAQPAAAGTGPSERRGAADARPPGAPDYAPHLPRKNPLASFFSRFELHLPTPNPGKSRTLLRSLLGWALPLAVVGGLGYAIYTRETRELSLFLPPEPGESAARPQSPRTPTLPEPTPIVIDPSRLATRLSTYAGPNIAWSLEPTSSADGRYISFTSLSNLWVMGDTNERPDVFVYDRLSGKVMWPPRGAGDASLPALPDWANSRSAMLSGDGRLAVFYVGSNYVTGADLGGFSCADIPQLFGSSLNCGDVYLFDTHSGEVRRITHPHETGGAPDAVYQTPTISADGSTLAFWSTVDAENDAAQPETCSAGEGAPQVPCMHLALYDVASGTTRRIQVGRAVEIDETFIFSPSRPSLSADGQRVAFTLRQSDTVAAQLGGLDVEQRAVVYDVQTGGLRFLDLSPADTLGNGASYYPALSSNGRYAAFISEAPDLVEGDENGASDVFVADLETGEMRLASADWRGLPGTSASGRIGFFEDSLPATLAISGDGQFVVFSTSAANLGTLPDATLPGSTDTVCNQNGGRQNCSVLVLKDMRSGHLKTLPQPGDFHVNTGPSISADGRYVAYTTVNFIDCEGSYPFSVCADIVLYDAQEGTGLALTTGQVLGEEAGGTGAGFGPGGEPAVGASVLPHSPILDEMRHAFQEDSWSTVASLPRLSMSQPINASDSRNMGAVMSLALSPDGSMLAAGNWSIFLWDPASRELVDTLQGDGGRVRMLAFSPDGEWLASGWDSGSVRIWRTTPDTPNAPRRGYFNLLNARTGGIRSLDFSPDGRWLAVGTDQGIFLWQRGERSFTYSDTPGLADGEVVSALRFSPRLTRQGAALLAASRPDGSILIYTLTPGAGRLSTSEIQGGAPEITARVIASLKGHSRTLTSLVFDATGAQLASGSLDGYINVWRIDGYGRTWVTRHTASFTYGELDPMRQQYAIDTVSPVRALLFSPDGRLLAGAGGETISYWDLEKTDSLPQVRRVQGLLSLAVRRDGSALYAGDQYGVILAWEMEDIVQSPQHFTRLAETEVSRFPSYDLLLRPASIPREARGENPVAPLVNPNSAGVSWERIFTQSIYDAQAANEQPLMAPLELPEGVFFQGAYIDPVEERTAVFRYDFTPQGSFGGVFFRQSLAGALTRRTQLPAGARVELVWIGSTAAELARGDWSAFTTTGGETSWRWDSRLPVMRLRWRSGGLALGLDYYGAMWDPSVEPPTLELSDLLSIANSVTALSALDAAEPVPFAYTVREGDTCTSIAARYATTINQMVRISMPYAQELTATNCDEIFVGQLLMVPLPKQVVAETNLDCDPALERLITLRDPSDPNQERLLGYSVQEMTPAGLYRDAATITIGDSGGAYYSYLATLPHPDCGARLLVQVNLPGQAFPTMNVMRWDGNGLEEVASLPGALYTLEQDDTSGDYTLKLRFISADWASCNEAVYIWRDGGFRLSEETLIPNPCP